MGNDRSLLLQLGRELRDSIHAGAALAALTLAAGCAGKDVTTTGLNPGDHPTTPNITTTPDTTTPDVTVTTPEPHDAATTPREPRDATPPAELPHEPYSLAQLGCFGPSYDGGYSGQCCFAAQCYTPEAGEACLPAEYSFPLRTKIPLPVGSGDCSCSALEQGHPDNIAGPFAANPADTGDRADAGGGSRSGSCCYVVGSISCTGRPFCVDGTQLVAEAVTRADWLLG